MFAETSTPILITDGDSQVDLYAQLFQFMRDYSERVTFALTLENVVTLEKAEVHTLITGIQELAYSKAISGNFRIWGFLPEALAGQQKARHVEEFPWLKQIRNGFEAIYNVRTSDGEILRPGSASW